VPIELGMDKKQLAEYMRQYSETGDVCLRAKWTMDGARTLAEAAKQVRAFADEIEDLAREGFELGGPVEDDYAFLIRPDDPDPPQPSDDD
jgi:hypothetical protein